VLLEEARLTSRVAEALNREVSVGEVVRAYLAHVQATVRFHTTVVLSIFDDEGVRVGTEILGRWSPEGGVDMTRIRREYTRDRLDDLLDQGKPVYSRDATTDRSIPAALRREQKADGRPALGLVPLVSQGRRIGLVVLSSPGYVEWDEPLYRPIELTASLLASALDSRMEHERANAARAAQLLDAERGRIAAELHDSVTQLLFAIHLNAEALRRKEAKDGSHGEQLAEMARTALRDMRSMLAELQPSRNGPQPTGVTDLGQALHQHANALAAKFRLTVSCAGPAWAGLDDNERHCVYRIAQEALSNAVKHSAATNVSVRLWLRDGRTTLEVKDDGIGLAVDWEPGMGMRGMRDRAARVGAQIAFVRRRGGGTVVRCRLGRRTV
jgi:signal transduction histidine kinase